MTESNLTGVKALLFDIGNVVIEIDFERVLRRWATDSGVDVASLRERFVHDIHYERHERGEIDAVTYFDSLLTSLGVKLDDCQLLAGWNEVFVGAVAGIEGVLEDVGRHLPTHAFSNTNAVHHREFARRFGSLVDSFESVFLSHEMGRRKPEAESFHAVADGIGAAPGEVVFFDDSANNIEGARAVGMRAVHVRSIDDVRRALAPLLQKSHGALLRSS